MRTSWLVQACKLHALALQVDPNWYQECYSLAEAARIIQMHSPECDSRVPACKVRKWLVEPLTNIGDGSCIFVGTSGAKDTGNWVTEGWDDKRKRIIPTKSPFLAGLVPLEEDMKEVAASYSDAVIGFMLRPRLVMSQDAVQTDFVKDVASGDRVVLEGRLFPFSKPVKLDQCVRLAGGMGSYFAFEVKHKSKRFNDLLRGLVEFADELRDEAKGFRARRGPN